MRIVTLPQQEIRDIAVHGTAHLRSLKVDVRLSNLLLRSVHRRLSLYGASLVHLLLFRSGREIRKAFSSLGLQLLDVLIGLPLLQDCLVRPE